MRMRDIFIIVEISSREIAAQIIVVIAIHNFHNFHQHKEQRGKWGCGRMGKGFIYSSICEYERWKLANNSSQFSRLLLLLPTNFLFHLIGLSEQKRATISIKITFIVILLNENRNSNSHEQKLFFILINIISHLHRTFFFHMENSKKIQKFEEWIETVEGWNFKS